MVRLVFVILLLSGAGAMASPVDKPCLPHATPTLTPGFPLVRAEAGGKLYEFHVTIDGKAVNLSPPQPSSQDQQTTLACPQTS